MHKPVDLYVQGSLLFLCAHGQSCDLTDESSIASEHYHSLSASLAIESWEECHIFCLEGVIWVSALNWTWKQLGLASERRIINFHTVRFNDTNIGWNFFAQLHLDQISTDQFYSRHWLFDTITDNCNFWWDEIFEALHHGFAFSVLRELYKGGDVENGHDDDAEVEITGIFWSDCVSDEAKNGSGPHEHSEKVGHVMQVLNKRVHSLFFS